MSLITDASSSAWTSASATTTREGWQVRTGSILLSTTATPGDADGIFLSKGEYVEFASGVTVKYRLPKGVLSATLVRESLG